MPEKQIITIVKWRTMFEFDSDGDVKLFAKPHEARLEFVEELAMHVREGKRVILDDPDYASVYQPTSPNDSDEEVLSSGELLYIGQVFEGEVN